MSDLETFLAPIDEAKPSGDDLRLASSDLTFSELDELRREADPLLDPSGESKAADWRGVASLCESCLTGKTKDLELAAVYTQAQIYMQGLEGLEFGLKLLAGLVGNFWETVYPGNDEGEIVLAIRARPLSWVGTSREFMTAVTKVPLSSPIGEEGRSWFDYEQAQRVDQAAVKSDQAAYQELIDEGYITTEQWHGALSATPPERLAATLELLRNCQSALWGLSTVCDEKFEDDAPYFTELSNLLDEMETFLSGFSSGEIAPEAVEGEEAVAEGGASAGGAPVAAGGPAGPITSRDEAYRRLREVAEYLRKTEPHSPVPPLIDRAVRWGNMTFENLFDDFVKNDDVRHQTKEMLGLEDPMI